MNNERIDELANLETKYWWHVGRRDVIRTLLRGLALPPAATVVDVGCGTGVNLPLLAKYGKVTGVEPNPLARRYAESHTAGRAAFGEPRLWRVVAGEATRLPIGDASVDLVTAFDVLEHVIDDEAALREFARVLKPGGRVFLLTPAHQFLWSEHDEALGHERRYTLSELHRKLDRAGFAVTRRTYCITFLFLPILFYRFIRSLFPRHGPARTSYLILPKGLNAVGVWFLRFEALILRFVNFPFGVTCAVIAEKRGERS